MWRRLAGVVVALVFLLGLASITRHLEAKPRTALQRIPVEFIGDAWRGSGNEWVPKVYRVRDPQHGTCYVVASSNGVAISCIES